jgi:methyl-accepting chemotaxis protein
MGFFKKFVAKDPQAIENEKILQALEQSQAVIYFSPDGTVLNANEPFLRLMGYSALDVEGRHHSLFVAPEEKASSGYAQFWDALRQGVAQIRQFKRITKSGAVIWIEASYNPLTNAEGEVYKIVKYATDITQNREAAAQARALMVCQTAIFCVDNNAHIKFCNPAANDLFATYTAALQNTWDTDFLQEPLGKSVAPLLAAVPQWQSLLEHLSVAQQLQQHWGEVCWQLNLTPWCDQQGTRLGSIIEVVDHTRAQAKLRDEQQQALENARIREALNASRASVILTDNQGAVVYANASAEQLFAQRRAALVAQAIPLPAASLLGFDLKTLFERAGKNNYFTRISARDEVQLNLGEGVFDVVASPVFDAKGLRQGTLTEWHDMTDILAQQAEEKRLADENTQIRQALDSVTTNVMIADNDGTIRYMNASVLNMMQNAQEDIRKAIPTFDANHLIGANMDIFHKAPEHQRQVIAQLRTTYKGKAQVAGRTFAVHASPIFKDGDRIGTIVEWADRTAEVAIEQEINEMFQAAAAGDFTRQISLDCKDGFFGTIAKGLNTLVSTVEVAMNDMLRMLGAMSKGNLSERITRDYQGTFGQLRNDANSTADKLTEVISKIRISASAIHTAAFEIAQGNTDLSQRTEQQASSLEQTASSMEQMTSTVRQSSENAQKANDLASQAQEKAKSGGEVVHRAVTAMEDIHTASKKIADIIGVIDEIAFQTNLLALNAAVEAARAGEQGRGFAVVAGEVRNLAQRSAGAAKEIKELIRDSVNKVQDGRELVNHSGKTLGEIVAAVEVVSHMMRDIANAAREQTTGIEQVNTAISQMDEMTQQNAALVEEATAAGQSMADQATTMNQIVEFFTFGQTNAASRAHKPAASQTVHAKTAVKSPAAKPGAVKSSSVKPLSSAKPVVKPIKAAKPQNDDEWEDF